MIAQSLFSVRSRTRICDTYDELLGDASGALNGRVLEGEHGVILLCVPIISGHALLSWKS